MLMGIHSVQAASMVILEWVKTLFSYICRNRHRFVQAILGHLGFHGFDS